jgi:hypothetical protein
MNQELKIKKLEHYLKIYCKGVIQMNKKLRLPFILAIVFLNAALIFGQGKPISAKEYDALEKAAWAKTEKKIRKKSTVDNQYLGEKLLRTHTLEQEYLPPGSSKWLSVIKSGEGELIKTELIYIGDSEYRKKNGGAWSIKDLKSRTDDEAGLGGSGESPDEIGIDYDRGRQAFEVSENLGENETEKYFLEEQTVEKKTYKVITKLNADDAKKVFSEYRIWINKEGLIYKFTSSFKSTSFNVLYTSISTYDYTIPTPKIEAPVK